MKTCKCTSHPAVSKKEKVRSGHSSCICHKSPAPCLSQYTCRAPRGRGVETERSAGVGGVPSGKVSRASASRDRPGERSGRDRRGRARDARAREMAVYFSSKISSPGAPTHTEWSLHRPSPDEPFSGVNLVAVAHADGAVGVYTGASRARARPRYHPRRRRVDFRPTLGRRRSSRRRRFLFFFSRVSAVLRRSPRRVPFGADTDDTNVVLFLLFSSRHRLDALSMMSR
jgi:hypothetical protein